MKQNPYHLGVQLTQLIMEEGLIGAKIKVLRLHYMRVLLAQRVLMYVLGIKLVYKGQGYFLTLPLTCLVFIVIRLNLIY